ncbi:MAG TPA: FAD-dependent oxidoreductase [Acidimicrobiales bacterium]|nr:FAD-dependent oxidoreductase [Acidimicrobiales bacterium]
MTSAPERVDELPADDDQLAELVRRGALIPLLVALAHTTGDLSLLSDELRPDPTRIREPQGGLSGEQRAQARRTVAAALRDWDRAGRPVVDDVEPAELRRMIAFLIGEPVSDDHLRLLVEELAIGDDDPRAPTWRKDDLDASRPMRVVVIGAGMSGLLAAHRLRQAGIDVDVIEKNDDVGGTWLENRYPGCRVDVPNHLYSYSFAQRADWPQHFSTQDVLLDYFRDCATEMGLRDRIRFRTSVESAVFRETTYDWELTLRLPGGGTETLVADAVVSAVGQLNRPSLPPIPGREDFAGPSFHSARWDHSVDLRGKRVAVIGTGASGFQLVPEVAEQAGEVVVFQRTPNWFLPAPEYHEDLADETRWLLTHIPRYRQWYRLWLFWRLAEGALPAARLDPDWPQDKGSISRENDDLRAMLTMYLEGQFADAPELVEQVVPRYPPLAKRMLLDDGTWARALKRDDVHLVTEPIERIEADAVVTTDGVRRPVDVVVYATGFEASRFLVPMQVTGRGGIDLHASWDGDARAYLGITVPGFPNLFCLYGPNTNLVANGSIIFFSECEVRYVLECLRELLGRRARALDCRREAFEAYNRRIDEGNLQMAWGVSGVNSWYKNAAGRVTQNWPFSLLEFWQQTRHPDLDDYELLGC